MRSATLTRRQFGLLLAAPALQAQRPKPRLLRSESFFGLHFDLHPNEKDTALGRDVSEEMIEDLLTKVRPDYVQYDSKGHPGWLGWPSQVGPSAPGIVKDSLELWRRVTARHGIALYIHFSGLYDVEAVKRHPEWARVDAEGKPDTRQTSTFGPYVDKLMIPQLREAASNYELDGVWVDGECWATLPDYYPGVAEAFSKATGIATLPKGPEDAGWVEFLEFNREQFREYVRHYVGELNHSHPKFQIASNWLYSTFVPEEPRIPVDFLSGDYLGNASISTARLEARYLAQTGKPWDLMAWGFQQGQSNAVGHVHKPAVQLQQEASIVLAQGGGFQVYYMPSRAGFFDEKLVGTMRSVARYCRARQGVSHQSKSVPQIGVVFSKETLYRTTNSLFGAWGKAVDPVRGMLDALLGCQWSVDVLPDWGLADLAPNYPLIVLPDWAAPGKAVKETLLRYARNGGKLLVCGAENAALFASEAGVVLKGTPSKQTAFLDAGEVLGNASGLWQDVEPGDAKVLFERFAAYDTRSGGKAAALVNACEHGEIVLAPGPIGTVYAKTHASAVKQFVERLVQPRFEPHVMVTAPPTVEVSLRTKGGALMVHLVNTTNMQVAGEYATTDFVPPVGPIYLWLGKTPPKSVALLPDETVLEPMLINERWCVEIPALKVHSVAVVLR